MQTRILTFVILGLLTTPVASNTPQNPTTAPGDVTLITGTIRNTDGETVNNATVSIKRKPGDFADSVTTGPTGKYSFDLRSGRFTVKATHPDYKPQSKVVQLQEGQQQLVNFTLSRKRR